MADLSATESRPWVTHYPEGISWDAPIDVTPVHEQVLAACTRFPKSDALDFLGKKTRFKELGDKPGMSFQSFGIGGAEIEGRTITADGVATPVSYRWFETDIRNTWANSTWSDAQTTFDRFARRLSRGDQLASR